MTNNLDIMRHSCSHLMAAAILELWPGTKLAIGPAIEEGFYYDFEFSATISDSDFPKIEAKMAEIKAENLPITKKEVSFEEAKKLFAIQPYKLELIKDLIKDGANSVSTYTLGDFLDLCIGPHVESTKDIGSFKLLSLAGAYWRGDEKNKMLTRIYGTCFPTQKELDHYLWQIEEAKKRDHRKLGEELDLFSQNDELGVGLILWHPKLSIVREEIELWWRQEHRKRGYQYVYTPHIGRKVLWDRSGHTNFYKDLMYPPLKDERNDVYFLKPMNCNGHMLIYKSKPRSYKELPIRWCELGTVYRYELEGVRHGILRPRGFTQDDAHIICTKEQLIPEIENVLDFALEMNAVFGFKDLHYDLSVMNPKDTKKYAGDPKEWRMAEDALEGILERRKVKFGKDVGGAKFYGPSIDLKAEDALGRLWQGTTIQFDFNLPSRFDLKYIGLDGKDHVPYMIHRTLLGSLERFVGVLIEQYAGAFPVWLSPVQVKIVPITDKHLEYGKKILEKLLSADIRVSLDERNETTSAKIRDAELQKIPYIIVIGDKEMKAKSVNIRVRGEKVLGEMSQENFIKLIKEDIVKKRQI